MIDRDMTTRYSQNELLWLLANMTLEHLADVSNRDIIRDKAMPTHHTYGNRFDSLQKAKDMAGLTEAYKELNYPEILKLIKKKIEQKNPEKAVALDFPIKTTDNGSVRVPIYIEGVGSFDILPDDPGDTIKAVAKYRKSVIPNEHHVCRILDLLDYI